LHGGQLLFIIGSLHPDVIEDSLGPEIVQQVKLFHDCSSPVILRFSRDFDTAPFFPDVAKWLSSGDFHNLLKVNRIVGIQSALTAELVCCGQMVCISLVPSRFANGYWFN